MIPRRVEKIVQRWLSSFSARRLLLQPLLLTIITSVLLGGASGELIARATNGDRVVVGNTGGTLSGVIQVGGELIVVGGGNARTDLADLVGRSTVPWQRHIDVVIIPGWDDQQPIGALGLIERGGVAQIVIAGQPDDKPVWNALEQAAAREGIPVTVVSGHNVVDIAPDIGLDLQAPEPTAGATSEYAVVSLHFQQSLLTFVDASAKGFQAMKGENASVGRSHILAAMRPIAATSVQTDVLLQARARTGADVTGPSPAYTGEIRSGQHVTIRLTKSELRLPLSAVTGNNSGASSPSPLFTIAP